jgi:hypothetical protein
LLQLYLCLAVSLLFLLQQMVYFLPQSFHIIQHFLHFISVFLQIIFLKLVVVHIVLSTQGQSHLSIPVLLISTSTKLFSKFKHKGMLLCQPGCSTLYRKILYFLSHPREISLSLVLSQYLSDSSGEDASSISIRCL